LRSSVQFTKDKNKPFAVSAYHRPDDCLDLVDFFVFGAGYGNIFLRSHGAGGEDLMVYAAL